MKKFDFNQLQEVIKLYVNPDKIGTTDYVAEEEPISHLIDKIGLLVTFDNPFVDPLYMFNGEDLPLGKTVEEYYQELILPTDYEDQGATTLAPNYPEYLPASYSKTLGRKKFKTTIKYNQYERAVNTPSQYVELVSNQYKRLSDSEQMFYYYAKKQGLGVLCNKVLESYNGATFGTSQTYEIGTYLKKDSTPTAVGVVKNKIASSNMKDWDTLVKEGFIVELHTITELEVPTDTLTGEAFIKAVKQDIEKARRPKQGYSLNGNSIGSEEGLILLIKEGIIPTLEVDVLAGAFHEENLALPAEIIPVEDFGEDKQCFAILCDRRMMKLHNTYRATREQLNAEGDFLNLVRHTENTLHTSRNTFVKVYKIKA